MSAGQLPLAWAGHTAERSRDCEAILARLRQGPATNRDLQAIAVGYRQRVSDLRVAGYVIVCSKAGVYTLLNGLPAAAPIAPEPMFGGSAVFGGSADPDGLPVYDGAVPGETPAPRNRMPTASCSVQGCEFHGLPCAECGDGPFCVPCLAGHHCGAPDAGRVL